MVVEEGHGRRRRRRVLPAPPPQRRQEPACRRGACDGRDDDDDDAEKEGKLVVAMAMKMVSWWSWSTHAAAVVRQIEVQQGRGGGACDGGWRTERRQQTGDETSVCGIG